MKKLLLILALLIGVSSVTFAQYDRQLEKKTAKMYKAKLKEYKNDGWKLNSNTKTLDVLLLQHYKALDEVDKSGNLVNSEIVGNTTDCKNVSVCRAVAENNAANAYANASGSYIKGRANSEASFASAEDESRELEKFYAAYERLISTEIKKGVMRESFSLIRYNPSSGKNEYMSVFLINEDRAGQARIRACEQAIKESQLNQQWAGQISNYVNEKFQVE